MAELIMASIVVVCLLACVLGVVALAGKGYRRVEAGFGIRHLRFHIKADDNRSNSGGSGC